MQAQRKDPSGRGEQAAGLQRDDAVDGADRRAELVMGQGDLSVPHPEHRTEQVLPGPVWRILPLDRLEDIGDICCSGLRSCRAGQGHPHRHRQQGRDEP